MADWKMSTDLGVIQPGSPSGSEIKLCASAEHPRGVLALPPHACLPLADYHRQEAERRSTQHLHQSFEMISSKVRPHQVQGRDVLRR